MALGAAALALALSGCGDLVLAPPFGTAALSFDPPDRVLDFREVETGKKQFLVLEIRNSSRLPVTFHAEPPEPPWSWDIVTPEVTVEGRGGLGGAGPPGLRIHFAFAPGLGQEGRFDGEARLTGPEGDYVIRLEGRAIEDPVLCSPAALFFGRVVVGEQRRLDGADGIRCKNRSSHPAAIRVESPIAFYPAGAFALDRWAIPLEIPPHETIEIPVRFLGQGPEGPAGAHLPILDGDTGDPLIPGQGVELFGHVVPTQVVQFGQNEPEPLLDFGFVPVGGQAELGLELRNRYDRPVTVTVDPLGDGSDFQVVGSPPDLGPASTPGDGGLLRVRFAPREVDRQTASLWVSVVREDAPGLPVRQEIRLTGFGGGPQVVCDPALDFGEWAVGTMVTGTVACRNEGTDLRTPEDDLEIVRVAVDGNLFHPRLVPGDGRSFAVEVDYRTLDEGLDLDELRVVTCAGAGCSDRDEPPASGIPSAGEGEELRPGDVVTRVQLTGTGVHLPPCDAAFDPPALAFGRVAPGASARLGVRLVNRGDAECALYQLRVAGSRAFALPGAEDLPARLGAGEAVFVPVEFRPDEAPAGPVQATAVVAITNPARPLLELPLTGDAGGSCLELDPPAVDFTAPDLDPPPVDPTLPDRAVDPALPCGAPDVRVKVRNRCADEWQVTAIAPAAGSDGSFLVPAPGTLPSFLAPSMEHDFPVDFRPGADGRFHGGIRVEATGPGGAREALLLPVQGLAAAGGRWVDRFALVKPKLDLLIVLAASSPMADAAVAAALSGEAGIANLLGALDRIDLDWQLGITTTDLAPPGSVSCWYGARNGGEAGRLVPGTGGRSRLLSPGMADFATAFAANVNGVKPCPVDERGFEAAIHAVSPPLITSSEDPRFPDGKGNLGLSRDGAHLAVVFVSAGDDESSRPAADVLAALAARKPPGLHSTWAIVGEPGYRCDFPGGGYAEPAPRYRALVHEAGYSSRSVCLPETWGYLWSAVGQQASVSRSAYPLDAPAATGFGAVEVFHLRASDRRKLDAVPAWWSYQPAREAVVLETWALQALLEDGGGLEVRYRLSCD